jgi:hypothetical protein
MPSDSNSDAPSVTAVPHERKQARLKELIVLRYNDWLVLGILLLTLPPAIFILLHWGFRPGLVWCSENEVDFGKGAKESCSQRTVPWIPDVVIVVVAGLMFAASFVLSTIILLASGSLMRSGIRNKLTAFAAIAIVLLFSVLMAVPPFYREVVLPLSAVHAYAANMTIIGDDVVFKVDKLSDELVEAAPADDLMLTVSLVAKDTFQASDVSPLATVVFQDTADDVTATNGDIERKIDRDVFKDGEYYAWIVSPVTDHSGTLATPRTYAKVDGDLVDIRYFALCKWDDTGCIEGCRNTQCPP